MLRQCLIETALLLTTGCLACWAQTIDDPLHAFCYGTTSCSDNGTVTPADKNPPQFGFTISPGPQTGDYLIEVLIPDNDANTIFTITGTQGGTTNTSLILQTTTSKGHWTSGNLDTFLGISASPNNPIGAFLPTTQADDAAANGYFVDQADLGQTKVWDNSNPSKGPLLNIGALPVGSLILSFLNTSGGIVATANSGALYEGHAAAVVPEPTSAALLATASLFVLTVVRKKIPGRR